MKKLIFFVVCFPLLSLNAQEIVKRGDLVLKNGLLFVKESSNPFSGKSASFHPNGEVAMYAYVKDGLKTGKIEVFFDSGKKRVITYEDANYVNYGETVIWNEEGTIAFEGKWTEGRLYKKGEETPFNGKITVYYINGILNEDSAFKNGQWNGKQVLRDRSGKITSECLFENNKIIDCKNQ